MTRKAARDAERASADQDAKGNSGDQKSKEIRDQLLETYESMHGIKEEIELGELFDERKTKGHDGKVTFVNPRTVLLLGRAGIGKTTLSCKIAYEWAVGNCYKDKFEAVYLLPVRKLNKYKDLESAISALCFPGMSQRDKMRLHTYLEQQLKERSDKVLIIFDGLDERRGGNTDEIIKTMNRLDISLSMQNLEFIELVKKQGRGRGGK